MTKSAQIKKIQKLLVASNQAGRDYKNYVYLSFVSSRKSVNPISVKKLNACYKKWKTEIEDLHKFVQDLKSTNEKTN